MIFLRTCHSDCTKTCYFNRNPSQSRPLTAIAPQFSTAERAKRNSAPNAPQPHTPLLRVVGVANDWTHRYLSPHYWPRCFTDDSYTPMYSMFKKTYIPLTAVAIWDLLRGSRTKCHGTRFHCGFLLLEAVSVSSSNRLGHCIQTVKYIVKFIHD